MGPLRVLDPITLWVKLLLLNVAIIEMDCDVNGDGDGTMAMQIPESEESSPIRVTRDEVPECLKLNKSLYLDGIHPRVFKELKFDIADLLTKILYLSFKSASGPVDWKTVRVTLN